jgi:spore coat polysaccharide biosynthesis protein SpsF (cytidylyltransferase family)
MNTFAIESPLPEASQEFLNEPCIVNDALSSAANTHDTMKTAIIIQARYGSSRLPGKAILPLGNATVLAQVIARCAQIAGPDAVVCAVPETGDSDPVAEEAEKCGALVVRGPEQDVLARYAKAARAANAETVMRITSDCPFVDPLICTRVLDLLDRGAEYASLDMPATWPHGLDCEAFPARLLFAAEDQAEDPFEREHVTPWIRARAMPKATLTGPGAPFNALRWTLDWPEDYQFLKTAHAALGESATHASAANLASLCVRRPDITAINAKRIDHNRLASLLRADIATDAIGFPIAA